MQKFLFKVIHYRTCFLNGLEFWVCKISTKIKLAKLMFLVQFLSQPPLIYSGPSHRAIPQVGLNQTAQKTKKKNTSWSSDWQPQVQIAYLPNGTLTTPSVSPSQLKTAFLLRNNNNFKFCLQLVMLNDRITFLNSLDTKIVFL